MTNSTEQLDLINASLAAQRLEEMAEAHGDTVNELLGTGSYGRIPFTNSLLQIDGYEDTINQDDTYTPELAVLHFPVLAESPAGIDLGVSDGLVTLAIVDKKSDAALSKRLASLHIINAYIRSTFYRDIMSAEINSNSHARHTLQEGQYYVDTAKQALAAGVTPSELITAVCSELGVPLSVTVGLRSNSPDHSQEGRVLAAIYYPLISSPTTALEGVKRAISVSAGKN